MFRETLFTVVQEGDERGPTLAYGWAEPDATWDWHRPQLDARPVRTRYV